MPDTRSATLDATPARVARMTVAYDGTDFRGFAESDGVPTVMGALRPAIERVVRQPIEPVAAGRTDAGVHGWGQVVSAALPADTDLDRLQRSVNRLCAPDIAIRDTKWATDGFSARFSATARTYRYTVWNDPVPNPLLARFSWHVPAPLAVDDMNTAAQHLLGEHDFSSFCRRPRPAEGMAAPSLVRRVRRAEWSTGDTAGRLSFEISATSYCHQMVRSVVGTLVDVGLGRRRADSMALVLLARDRNAAGQVAPPTGLVLVDVDYSGERWDA